MAFDYSPLWKLLIDKKWTKERFRTEVGLSPAVIAKMGKGENVSLDVLDRICNALACRIEDIVIHIPPTK